MFSVVLITGLFLVAVCWLVHFVAWVNSKMLAPDGSVEWLKVNGKEDRAQIALKFYFGDNFGWTISVLRSVFRVLIKVAATLWRFTAPAIVRAAKKIQLSLSIARLKILKARAEKKAKAARKIVPVIPKARQVKADKKKEFVPIRIEEPKTELLATAKLAAAEPVAEKDEELTLKEKLAALFAKLLPAKPVKKPVPVKKPTDRDLLDQYHRDAEKTVDYRTQMHYLELAKTQIPLDIFIRMPGGAEILDKYLESNLWVRRRWESVCQYYFSLPFEELNDESWVRHWHYTVCLESILKTAIVLPSEEKPADPIVQHFQTSLPEQQSGVTLANSNGVSFATLFDKTVGKIVHEDNESLPALVEKPNTEANDASRTSATANPPAAATKEKTSEPEIKIAKVEAVVTGKEDKEKVSVLIKQVDRTKEVQTRQTNPQSEGESMKFWEDLKNVLGLIPRLKGRSKDVKKAHDELIVAALKKQVADTNSDVLVADKANMELRRAISQREKESASFGTGSQRIMVVALHRAR